MLRLFMVMCKVALFIYILILFKKMKEKKKKKLTWLMMWLNWNIVIINVTFQLLDIYRW